MNSDVLKNIGVGKKLTPIMSFNTIVDSDFGLANYIYDKYFDKNIFDEAFFTRDIKSIIRDIYNRSDKNVLYILAKKDVDKKLLDEYYEEFINTKRKEIYEYSITTEMLNLINSFNNESGEVTKSCIIYYYPEQLEILKNEPVLNKNPKVYIHDLNDKNKNNFEQLFFKDWYEALQFGILRDKSYYISSANINMVNNKENNNIVNSIIKNRNYISKFDMYNIDILGEA